MRIGELAARAEVNIQTLRFYDREGLIPAPGRTASACSSKQETLMAALYRAEFFRERLAIEADGYRTLDQAKMQGSLH